MAEEGEGWASRSPIQSRDVPLELGRAAAHDHAAPADIHRPASEGIREPVHAEIRHQQPALPDQALAPLILPVIPQADKHGHRHSFNRKSEHLAVT